jgi:hypothetical protein
MAPKPVAIRIVAASREFAREHRHENVRGEEQGNKKREIKKRKRNSTASKHGAGNQTRRAV